jgi:hypothetical protein
MRLRVYKRVSSWNLNTDTLKPDRPQHYHTAACYRRAVFFGHLLFPALSFPYKKKFGALFKNIISILFTYFKMACLKLRNLKLRKWWSVCASTKPRPLIPKQSSIHYSFIILPWADTIWANDSVGERVIHLMYMCVCVCVCVCVYSVSSICECVDNL